MYVQPEGVFRCLVDYDDNVSGSPTEAAVALGFNGPVLCHKGTFFFPKGCHVWLRGRCQLVLAFFFLYPPQCRAGASWRAADSQSSVQLALRVGGGGGELDCDG